MLKLRYAMDLSELCTELVGFIDNVDYATGAIFSSIGCDSLYCLKLFYKLEPLSISFISILSPS